MSEPLTSKKLAIEALEHVEKVFKSMADRGRYPSELLPYIEGEPNQHYLGKQGWEFLTDALNALRLGHEPPASLFNHMFTWIHAVPHSDNCFVRDEYPGNTCVCGKESLMASIEEYRAAQPPAVSPKGNPCLEAPDGCLQAADGSECWPCDFGSREPSGYTIEPHGDGHALYSGRDRMHHGFNLARITEATLETLTLIENALNARPAPPPSAGLLEQLKAYMLDQEWHKRCEIIPDYMPPHPSKETRPTVQIRYNDGSEHPPFLRHSAGPKQGFFWDIYGDDMQNIPLAIIALSQAPYPRAVGPIVFKVPFRSAPTKETGMSEQSVSSKDRFTVAFEAIKEAYSYARPTGVVNDILERALNVLQSMPAHEPCAIKAAADANPFMTLGHYVEHVMTACTKNCVENGDRHIDCPKHGIDSVRPTPPPPPVHAEWCAAVAQIPGKCDCAAQPPPVVPAGWVSSMNPALFTTDAVEAKMWRNAVPLYRSASPPPLPAYADGMTPEDDKRFNRQWDADKTCLCCGQTAARIAECGGEHRPTSTKGADLLATEDAMNYGSGFVRVMPDGSREHVPHQDVFIEPSGETPVQHVAQHEETGRMWRGPKDQIPKGYTDLGVDTQDDCTGSGESSSHE